MYREDYESYLFDKFMLLLGSKKLGISFFVILPGKYSLSFCSSAATFFTRRLALLE